MYKFKPILKSMLWGGDKIIPYKGVESDKRQVGESWEISGVKVFLPTTLLAYWIGILLSASDIQTTRRTSPRRTMSIARTTTSPSQSKLLNPSDPNFGKMDVHIVETVV